MSYSNFNDNAVTVTNGFENYVKKVKSKKVFDLLLRNDEQCSKSIETLESFI